MSILLILALQFCLMSVVRAAESHCTLQSQILFPNSESDSFCNGEEVPFHRRIIISGLHKCNRRCGFDIRSKLEGCWKFDDTDAVHCSGAYYNYQKESEGEHIAESYVSHTYRYDALPQYPR